MTSPCERIDRLLAPYVDGELPPPLAECVKSHLTGCRRCTGKVEELRRPFSLLRSWPAVRRADLERLTAQREELVAAFARSQAGVSTAGSRAPAGPWVNWSAAAAAGAVLTGRALTRAAGAMARFLLAATKNAGRQSQPRNPGLRRPAALALAGRGALAVGGAVLRAAFRAGRSALALG